MTVCGSRCLRTRYVLAGLVVAAAVGGAAYVMLRQPTWSARVAEQLRLGVPLGSSRGEAEAWLGQRYGYIPGGYCGNIAAAPDSVGGHRVAAYAGWPETDLGGWIGFVERRPGLSGRGLDYLRFDEVIGYILLDRDQRVCGYVVLSLREDIALRERNR
jgi:hypothetical protein